MKKVLIAFTILLSFAAQGQVRKFITEYGVLVQMRKYDSAAIADAIAARMLTTSSGSGTTSNGAGVDLVGTLTRNMDIAGGFSVRFGRLVNINRFEVTANGDIVLSTGADIFLGGSTLGAASNGYVWKLVDNTTGRAGWSAIDTGSVASFHLKVKSLFSGTSPIVYNSTTGAISINTMSATVGGAVPTPPNDATRFLNGQGAFTVPAGGGDVTLAGIETFTGAHTWNDTKFLLRNVANTFSGKFTNTITAARTWTLKDADGTLAFVSDIPAPQTISITGDATAAGSTGVLSATVTKINGTSLGGLATGILKNTTTTGVPSIAVSGDFPTLNQNSTGYSTHLAGGNNTTLLGSVPYQSNTNTTTMLSPNVTTTKKFFTQTGDGTNGAAPGWNTIVAGDVPTLNQSTTGSAATLTNPRNIQGVAFNGSAAIDIINGTGFVKATGTTLSYDNSTYLTTASAASTYQPLNSNLTTVAGLTATTDNFIVSSASAWASRTPAQVRTTLALVVGTDVEAHNANLTTIAGLTATTDNFMIGTASAWASRTPTQARTQLGATTVGGNIFTLTNPSAISWARINADNTVTTRTAAQTLGDIGAQASGSYAVTTNNLSDLANAGTARTNLGGTTVGQNIFTLTNPSALGYNRINADNTVTHRSYANVKIDLSLDAVENTALSTWAGSANITTLGSIATGTWSATTIALNKGGTGSTTASGARIAILPSMTANALKILRVNAGETDFELAAAGGGSGTVTNTGNLTANSVVLGNGVVDTKTVAGITTDGTAQINLGVNATTKGTAKFYGLTSGDVTVQAQDVAGTATVVKWPNAASTLPIYPQQMTFTGMTAARTVTFPDANWTAARTDAANTFTGVQTMTSPVLVTPDLGTPSALVGTNISGTGASFTAGNVTTNANLTGDVTSSGNATTIAAPSATTVNNNTGGWVTLKVSGSDATTTGQTLVDITGLVTGTLSVSSNYEVEATLIVSTTAVTTGTEYGINCTGTGTTHGAQFFGPSTVTAGAQVMNEDGTNINNTASTPAFLTTASETGIIKIFAIVGTGTGSPTIAIRHLKVTSGTSTVKIGSIMRYRKLGFDFISILLLLSFMIARSLFFKMFKTKTNIK